MLGSLRPRVNAHSNGARLPAMGMPWGRHTGSAVAPCPQCSEGADIAFIAESRVGELTFSRSTKCSHCSFAEEASGSELTEDARTAFYAAEGRWSLAVSAAGPRRQEVLKLLRDLLDDGAPEVMKLVKDRSPVATGTLVEIEMFELPLAGLGATTVRTKEED